MNEDWRSKDDHRIDLELENATLEKELAQRGRTFPLAQDTAPDIYNGFLKQIAHYEGLAAGGPRPMRSLFAEDCEFPAAETLSDKQLRTKLGEIRDTLAEALVLVDPMPEVPDGIVYEYIVRELIPHEEVFRRRRGVSDLVIYGCTDECDYCYQREWCDEHDEVDSHEVDDADWLE